MGRARERPSRRGARVDARLGPGRHGAVPGRLRRLLPRAVRLRRRVPVPRGAVHGGSDAVTIASAERPPLLFAGTPEEERQHAAVHESGHAVLAVAVGTPPNYVELWPAQGGETNIQNATAEQMLLVVFAGEEAEKLVFSSMLPSPHDSAKFHYYAAILDVPEEKRAGLELMLREFCRIALDARREALDRLADALLAEESGYLDGGRVRALILDEQEASSDGA
jgi:hypothetical protein